MILQKVKSQLVSSININGLKTKNFLIINRLQCSHICSSQFKNYVSKRRILLGVRCNNSNFYVISTGVAQGSVLDPLLFLFHIKDLTSTFFIYILQNSTSEFANCVVTKNHVIFHFQVRDGLGWGEQKLINDEGCPTDTEIMGMFEYSEDKTKASVHFQAHKFPYTASVYYQCNVKLCLKADNGCDTVVSENIPCLI